MKDQQGADVELIGIWPDIAVGMFVGIGSLVLLIFGLTHIVQYIENKHATDSQIEGRLKRLETARIA